MKVVALLSASLLAAASAAFSFQGREDSPVVGPDPASEAAAVELTSVAAAAPAAWSRPAGPVRIALQAGHWKAAEAPDEQAGLRTNGTRGGGKAEWEVNLDIAQRTAKLLEAEGYVVDILPTTIPPGYWADLFIAIHADGNTNQTLTGYRAAAPRRDRTGKAAEFADLLEQRYGEATGMRHYPTVTRRMQGYYAFNSRRYHHALDPNTIGVIIETGFLTSPRDREIIVADPDRPARGIAAAASEYLAPLKAMVSPQPRIVQMAR
jgi:N-acetylmuramoyl-L-alanine amidase